MADAILAGEFSVESIADRCEVLLGKRWRWIRPLARRVTTRFGSKTRPRRRDLMGFLRQDRGFRRAQSRHSFDVDRSRIMLAPQKMQPVAPAAGWDVPVIESVRQLAEWLEINPENLLWFADLKGLEYRESPVKVTHYHYRALPKASGGIRLIEMPKQRLKTLQRQILTQILDKIPPLPEVHGFVKGRSIKSFVAPHSGQQVVLRMDLQNFFPSFRAARVQALFRTMGYPEQVADLLTGICTNTAPRSAWRSANLHLSAEQLRETWEVYSRPHLPQGSPASPALANLCAYRLDCRLRGLARSAGAAYTRYADDLAFSGGEAFSRRVELFSLHLAAIALEEGFAAQHHKTRIMRQGVRQHLAGLVINDRPNIIRRDRDLLEAILINCLRHGPTMQNRDNHPHFRSHIDGCVAFLEMIHPARGARFREMFRQIDWT